MIYKLKHDLRREYRRQMILRNSILCVPYKDGLTIRFIGVYEEVLFKKGGIIDIRFMLGCANEDVVYCDVDDNIYTGASFEEMLNREPKLTRVLIMHPDCRHLKKFQKV